MVQIIFKMYNKSDTIFLKGFSPRNGSNFVKTLGVLMPSKWSRGGQEVPVVLSHSMGPVPRSFKTFREDGLLNISPREFIGAFMSVRQTCLLPSVQWTNIQILTRTLWTNLKESSTARGEA